MGNRYTYLLIVLVMLFAMPMIVAQPVFKQNTDINVSVPCTIAGQICSSNATCITTVINPDGDVLVNNQNMVRNDAVFEVNLTANQIGTNGEYEFNIACSDNGNSFSKFLTFWVTPNGEMPSTSKGIIYVGLLVALIIFFVLLIIGGIKAEHIALKTFLLLFAYLFLIGITFISWNLSADYLTSSPFTASFFRIVWWVLIAGFFPLILLSTFYTLWMMLQIEAIQKMIDKGIPEDEAYKRQVRGGLRGIFKGR